MTKLKNPLFSFKTQGKLGAITMRHSRNVTIAETIPLPKDAKSPLQLAWRTMYQAAVAWWHTLSASAKQEWESDARPFHMTGFAYFISKALKPNPGIYLPLTGGTMSGAIAMGTSKITGLGDPAAGQDAVTKTYADLIPKFVIVKPSINVLTDLNRVADSGWVALNVTAATSAKAQHILILVEIRFDIIATNYSEWCCIPDDFASGRFPDIMIPAEAQRPGIILSYQLIIDLKASTRVFDWRVIPGTGAQTDTWIDVMGYWEY